MDYGLGTSIANGLKEGLIGYQTMRQIKNQEDQQKRQQQMQGLLSGVQTNQQTGQLEFTPEMRLQRAQEARIRENQEAQLNPTSGPSQQARALMGGLLGPKTAIPENMSASQLKEYMPAIIAGMKDNDLEKELKKAQIANLKTKAEKVPEEKNLPQNVYAAATYAQRLDDANKQMEKLMSDPKKFDPTNIATSFGSKFLPETFRSEDMKLMEQAKRNFINAVLRRESGSAISASEFESGDAQYFPQPGDTKAVLDQKKRNREVAISGLTAEGSKAMPKVQQGLLQQQSAPVLGPLNGNSVNKSEKPSWAL